MAQMPALIPKEVEIQRLKKIYIMVIMLGSIAASVEVDNFVVEGYLATMFTIGINELWLALEGKLYSRSIP